LPRICHGRFRRGAAVIAELHLDYLTMPIACTTGGKDRAVPPESVLRMAEALKAKGRPVKLIHRPDGGHSTNYDDALAAFEFVIGKVAKAGKP
jgi:dipeptidyl aminopeptidase/acylaminoacyl peptidase